MASGADCTDDVDLKDRGVLVKTFWDAVDHGAPRLQSIPGLIKRILETGAWRRRLHNGQLYEHERFLDFLTSKPFSGCGYDPAQIEALIKDDKDVLTLYEQAVVGKHGGINQHNRKTDNISLPPQHGTSRAGTLRRLAKDYPKLHSRVIAGELSANAAAIEAGFRKPPNPLSQIKKLLPKLSDEERRQLKDLL